MISVIVSDLGNVLLPFNYKIMVDRFNSIDKGLGDKFAELYYEDYEYHRDFERGKISRADFVKTMLERLDNKVTGEEFCKIFSEIFSVNQEVADLLPRLKKNYTLCLLSNRNEIHEEYGYRHYNFLKHFDKLFLSHEVGYVKPEKEIYAAVETFTGKPPEEHLFIDDILEYVNGAKNCGWQAVQFNGYNNLIEDFKKHEIIL